MYIFADRYCAIGAGRRRRRSAFRAPATPSSLLLVPLGVSTLAECILQRIRFELIWRNAGDDLTRAPMRFAALSSGFTLDAHGDSSLAHHFDRLPLPFCSWRRRNLFLLNAFLILSCSFYLSSAGTAQVDCFLLCCVTTCDGRRFVRTIHC